MFEHDGFDESPTSDDVAALAQPDGELASWTDPGSLDFADQPTGETISVPGADGTGFSGEATVDVDGDGTLDTVVVASADGSVTAGTDLDGDGTADRLVVIASDGAVTVSESDAHGDWSVVATGSQGPDGSITVTPAAPPPAADPTPTAPAPTEPAPTAPDPTSVPAGHLAVADGTSFHDGGVAEYDLDHDGVAETSVDVSDGVMRQYSDTDGDGRADQLLEVTIGDKSARILVDDGNGEWKVAAAGTIAPDGDFVPTENPSGTPASGTPAAGESGGASEPPTPAETPTQPPTEPPAETPTETPTQAPTETPAEPPTETPAETPAHTPTEPPAETQPAGLVVTMPDGKSLELGPPDQDIDGDGVADSVAVRTGDGHVLVVTDADGDGTAEQVIDVNPDSGQARWLSIGDDGAWSVVQHGHVTADGGLAVAGPGDLPVPNLQGGDQVSITLDGRTFPAGPASIDSDGDGVPDTVVVQGVGGATVHYQDTDGDGIADRAWTVNADGTEGARYLIDASGKWIPDDEGSSDSPGRN